MRGGSAACPHARLEASMMDNWPHRILILTEVSAEGGDFGRSFAAGLRSQGCEVTFAERYAYWPNDFDLILAYGPFSIAGSMLPVGGRLLSLPADQRPKFVWWLTEGIPDRSIPQWLIDLLARARLRLDRSITSGYSSTRSMSQARWLRGHRLRVIGELKWFNRHHLLDVLVVTASVRAEYLRQHGLRPIVVPLGYDPDQYGRDLNLTRDMDVCFLGQVAPSRRLNLLTHLTRDLERRGISVSIHSTLYAVERTRFLNRSKIMLNILRAPHDYVGQRLLLGAANKALVVSEPMQDCAPLVAGQHLVVAPIDQLADTIEYYLKNEPARRSIVDDAYRFIQQEMPIERSMKPILDQARAVRS
jgi:glycosyltransferase involved in cell wall biosynthesis